MKLWLWISTQVVLKQMAKTTYWRNTTCRYECSDMVEVGEQGRGGHMYSLNPISLGEILYGTRSLSSSSVLLSPLLSFPPLLLSRGYPWTTWLFWSGYSQLTIMDHLIQASRAAFFTFFKVTYTEKHKNINVQLKKLSQRKHSSNHHPGQKRKRYQYSQAPIYTFTQTNVLSPDWKLTTIVI